MSIYYRTYIKFPDFGNGWMIHGSPWHSTIGIEPMTSQMVFSWNVESESNYWWNILYNLYETIKDDNLKKSSFLQKQKMFSENIKLLGKYSTKVSQYIQ